MPIYVAHIVLAGGHVSSMHPSHFKAANLCEKSLIKIEIVLVRNPPCTKAFRLKCLWDLTLPITHVILLIIFIVIFHEPDQRPVFN